MKFVKNTRFWLLLFAALLILAGAGLFFLRGNASVGKRAVLTLDGEVYREIDLMAVTVPYEFQVETEPGINTVRVEHGRIAVTGADCPDQVCVRQGFVESEGVPIVCLPHRLVIQVEGAQ